MKEKFTCSVCKKEKSVQESGGTGYGLDKDENKICYECCAKGDIQYMKKNHKITLYLTDSEVTNWPGTLRFSVTGKTTGRHNFAGVRYDIWFTFDGSIWHGVQYGDNTQLCHCKKTIRKV